MNTAQNKYHPPSLHSFAEPPPSLSAHEGKAIHGVLGWEDISEEYHLLFPFWCWEVRLPKVSLFRASLMEREIIMSWPVNNCMPQWDICQYDMLYVLHPWWSLTKERGTAFLPLSLTLLLAIYCRQTNQMEADAEEEKKRSSHKRYCMCCEMHTSRPFLNLFFFYMLVAISQCLQCENS